MNFGSQHLPVRRKEDSTLERLDPLAIASGTDLTATCIDLPEGLGAFCLPSTIYLPPDSPSPRPMCYFWGR